MGTIAEEIFSRKIGRPVEAGEMVVCDVDYIMSQDSTTPLAIEALNKMGKPIFDPNKLVIHLDHFYPAPTINGAILHQRINKFVVENQIKNFFKQGVCHQVTIEKGFVYPGGIVVGADSHTCTYGALGCFGTGMGSTDIAVSYATGKNWFLVPKTIRFELYGSFPKRVYAKDLILHLVSKVGAGGATYMACEFGGELVDRMSISERITLANMAVEMGGKAGLIKSDKKTEEFLKDRVKLKWEHIAPKNPKYEKVIEVDVSKLTPLVAYPHRVDQVKPIEEVEGTPIDCFFLGTCTNGRLDDLKIAAEIIKGKKIPPDRRFVVTPASNEILEAAEREGILKIFRDAGAVVCNPGCSLCIGRHQGVLAPGEKALTSMNRNFIGRMGSPEAEIYLASPATVAISAVNGAITDPRRAK